MMIRSLLTLLFAFALPVLAHAETLHVSDPKGQAKAIFDVEVARTQQERETGLMNRKTLLKNSGMIFLFEPPQEHVRMWMLNTYIPLDILFIAADGKIFHIEENMKPRDLTPRGPKQGASAAVVEIPGGSVELRQIKIGDQISTTTLVIPGEAH